ncbi:hypothetical protein CHUAL_010352 [Chamberlinius hualienensis]
MALNRFSFVVCLIMAAFILTLHLNAAAQRKPQFNGSIFGKRASGVAGYDGGDNRLYAACVVAMEACSPIFQSSES